MQVLPDKEDMLDAVAVFLAQQAAPAADDPALAFRLKVAAHLVRSAAEECRAEGEQDSAELGALTAMLEHSTEPASAVPTARHAQIRRLYSELAERIRASRWSDTELAELRQRFMQLLASQLRITQPRFRLEMDIERPPEV